MIRIPTKADVKTGKICFVEAEKRYYYRITRPSFKTIGSMGQEIEVPGLDVTFGPFDNQDKADFDFSMADAEI